MNDENTHYIGLMMDGLYSADQWIEKVSDEEFLFFTENYYFPELRVKSDSISASIKLYYKEAEKFFFDNPHLIIEYIERYEDPRSMDNGQRKVK